MAQFARPDSDTSIGSWTGSPVDTSGNRFQNIDESTASDSDYVLSPNNPNGAGAEFGLSNVSDPSTSSGHIVRYRIAQGDADGTIPDGGGTAVQMVVTLRQGGTDIANSGTINLTGSFADGSFTLSGTEADSITDYNDLRLFVSCTGGAGSPANRRCGVVSWAELEVPNATQIISANLISTSTTLFSPAVNLRIFANSISGTVLFNHGVLVEQIVEANFISATLLYNPSVGALIEAQFIGESTQVFSPSNVHQEIIALLLSQTAIYEPAALLTIESQFINAGTSVFDPATQYLVAASFLNSGAQVLPPAIGVVVSVPAIAAATDVFNPAAIQLVQAELIALTQLYNPSVEAAGTPQSVVTLLISGTALFNPTAIEDQVISAELIGAVALIHNPDVAVVILAAAPTVGSTVLEPSLISDQIATAQLIADGQLFSPSVSMEAEGVPARGPFTLSSNRGNQLRRGKASGLSVLRRLGN